MAFAARSDWRTMNPTAAWLSVTGSVLGMAQIAVNPPATAARAPVATVSRSSWPGSRRWTWMSISPGATTLPRASMIRAPSGAPRLWAQRLDLTVLEQEVGDLVQLLRGVDHPAPADQDRFHRSPPSAWAQSGEPPASR